MTKSTNTPQVSIPPQVKLHFQRTALTAANNIDKNTDGNKYLYQHHKTDINTIVIALMNGTFDDQDEHKWRYQSILARCANPMAIKFEVAHWIAQSHRPYDPER